MDPYETKIHHIVLIAAVAVLIIIGSFLYNMIRYNKKFRKLNLHRLNENMDLLEKEKLRIAADLHDDIGPLISSILLKLQAMDPSTQPSATLIKEAIRVTDTTMERIRTLSVNLMPVALEKHGVAFIIRQFLDCIKSNKLQVNFFATDIPVLTEKEAVGVYRIIQEIVHNTMKHAEASTLAILLSANKKEITINTKDNGKGFQPSKATHSLNGLGIYIMRQRVEMLEGALHLKSELKKGTSYYISIPLQTSVEK